jgi:AmiR/NasT family two-component response regulator
MIKMPIAFTEEQYEWLRQAAFQRREPMARLVREAVEEYRAHRDPQLGLPLEG